MELRFKFDEDVTSYDQWRPNYVPELFGAITDYANLDSTKKALEIGIGTGKATLPILNTGCDLTAIEIGKNLAAYAKQKFRKFNNFNVINIDFESFQSDKAYDLIYSATAFHWIPGEIGYRKAFDLLNHKGTLALFWNHPFVNRKNDTLHQAIQKFYEKYPPSNSQPPVEFNKANCERIINILKEQGFKNIFSRLFYQTRKFYAQDYISLLNTYSDHRAIPEETRKRLEQGIFSVIEEYGGVLTVYDTMDLYLATKG